MCCWNILHNAEAEHLRQQGDTISYMEAGKLHIYDNKQSFINDARTGVQNEIGFWNKLL